MQKGMLLGGISGNMMDLLSVGDLHMKTGLFFKMCCKLDKIEGPNAETIVWDSMRMFCIWGQTRNHSLSLYS